MGRHQSADAVKDYYRILGVPEDADTEVIKRAYRRRVKELHPDRAGPEATRAFQEVQEAYEVLRDPVKRAVYDAQKRRARMSAGTHFTATARTDTVFHFGRLQILPEHRQQSGIYGGGLDVYLQPHEAITGTRVHWSVDVELPCRFCGDGFWASPHCPLCHGTGWTVRRLNVQIPIYPQMVHRPRWHLEVHVQQDIYLCLDLFLHVLQ